MVDLTGLPSGAAQCVDDEFWIDVKTLLRNLPDTWRIYYVCRTCQEQARLYAQGRTTPGDIVTDAKPGQTPHEFGLAVDVVLIVDGQEVWDYRHPAWNRLWAAVLASPTLHSGHNFPPKFIDNDHIQSLKWYAKRAELIKSGVWNSETC